MLEHLSYREDSKWHSLPSLSAKHGVDGSEESRWRLQHNMPDSTAYVHSDCGHFSPMKLGSNMFNGWQWLMLMLVLRCMGSMQIRYAPFFYCTTTIELIQDVGFVAGTTMSCWTKPSKVSLRCYLKATGTRLGPCFTVSIFRSSRMLYSPSY